MNMFEAMKNNILWMLAVLSLSIISACCSGPDGSESEDCKNASLIEQIGFSFSLDSVNNGYKLSEIDTTWVLFYEKVGNNYFGKKVDSVTYLPFKNPTGWFAFSRVDYNQTASYTSNLSYKIIQKNVAKIYEITAVKYTPVKAINKCCDGSGQRVENYSLNGMLNTNKVIELTKN